MYVKVYTCIIQYYARIYIFSSTVESMLLSICTHYNKTVSRHTHSAMYAQIFRSKCFMRIKSEFYMAS